MSTVDSPEEFTGSNEHRKLIKRKRTKRQRPASPFTAVPAAITTTSSSSTAVDEFHGVSFSVGDRQTCSIPSPIASNDETTTYESTTTEEEEDMANCLILLAQSAVTGSEKLKTSRKVNDKSATTMIGSYGYECKTCNRTFNSFQALGGHRASHKRPKSTNDAQFEYNSLLKNDDKHEKFDPIVTTKPSSIDTFSPIVTNQNKSVSKIHECSICGAEFSSGQALGGHMRRHRTVTTNQIANTMDMDSRRNNQSYEAEEQGRKNLLLDLNLPAPEDDHRDSKFQFMFSSPALVNCHY